ncbi:MAG TPA: cell division protein FtsZ, partial [Chloroflexota bacterium]|nr:cell division protein FtsZ [Chloroflexota bacterium]
GVLFNISGGPDLTIFEVNAAAEVIQRVVHADAQIIFGAVIDEARRDGEVQLTVIATGFDAPADVRAAAPNGAAQFRGPAPTIRPVAADPPPAYQPAVGPVRDVPPRQPERPVAPEPRMSPPEPAVDEEFVRPPAARRPNANIEIPAFLRRRQG